MVTLKDREIIDSVNRQFSNQTESDYGFTTQGRGYFENGLSEHAAKYPSDTWVGSFRLLGWHLAKQKVEPQPDYSNPEHLEVGSRCTVKEVVHIVYAYADGKALIAPDDNSACYRYGVVDIDELSNFKTRK